MAYNLKKFVEIPVTAIRTIYKFARHIDYKVLNQYILNINQNYNLDSILYELSRCLKDILDYELFGFIIKDGESVHAWVDPRAYKVHFLNMIKKDFPDQNIDFKIHYFDDKILENNHHIAEELNINDLFSYQVADKNYIARLYILSKRTMLNYHEEIINTLIKTLSIAVENYMNIKRLETEITIDPLTNCYNRRALDNYIEHDIANVERYGGDLAVIMFDIDHFKIINDSYGHQAGDTVLKEISRMVRSSIRKSDYVVRYGGEEFLLILPDTKFLNATELAEKLRRKIERYDIGLGRATINITASFGVAKLKKGSDKNKLLQEADRMLYKAKQAGRNTVMPNLRGCIPDIPFGRSLVLLPPVTTPVH